MKERPTKKQVLVVDDDESLRTNLRLLLQSSFEVHTAASVDEAHEVLRSASIDAMLLDLNMPGKSGVDGLEEFLPAYPDLAVLVLTGYADARTVEHVKSLGARGLMRKPFELVALVTTLFDMTGLGLAPTSISGLSPNLTSAPS